MNSMNYETIHEYLTDLPISEQQNLQRLRNIIHSTIPNCNDRIAYKICVFSINKDLVGFASQKNYLSFYTMSPTLAKNMKKELQVYDLSGAIIYFSPQKPLPKSLIQKILKARLKEIIKMMYQISFYLNRYFLSPFSR